MSAEIVRHPVSNNTHQRVTAICDDIVEEKIAEAIRQDRVRVAELIMVAEKSAKLGVPFCLSEAVTGGMLVDAAREYVMTVAAGGSEDVG
jgi:hypothetical protein